MVDKLIDTRPSGVSGMGLSLQPTMTPSNIDADDYLYFDPKLLQNSSKE